MRCRSIPFIKPLKDIRANFDLPKNEFEALIDGMQMDLEQARYGSFDELSCIVTVLPE